jgi:hypothetical protein
MDMATTTDRKDDAMSTDTTITITMTSLEAGAIYSALLRMYGKDHLGSSQWPEMVEFGLDLMREVDRVRGAEKVAS